MALPTEEEFVRKWVPQLEQAAHIKEHHARRWYNDVMELEPGRFEWHFDRLKGWGGSDIGEIAASYLGEPNLFSTVYELGMDKLMIRSPGGQTPHMRRGTLLEEPLSIIFREDYNATRRTDLVEAIMQTRDPSRSWLRGNPDDVVEIESSGGKSIIIPDYKCSADFHEYVPIQYVCQVHQYHYLLELSEKNEEGDAGLAIVYFDYENGKSMPIGVPFEERCRKAVLEGGDKAWAHVVAGELDALAEMRAPREVADFQYEFSDEDKALLAQLEDKWSSLYVMRKSIAEKYDKVCEDISAVFKKYGPMHGHADEMPLSMAGTTIRRTVNKPYMDDLIERKAVDRDSVTVEGNSYDPDLMADYLLTTGVDVTQFISRKYDAGKVESALLEAGFNVGEAISEGISYTLRVSKKKGITKEDIEHAGEVAASVIDQAEKQLQEMSEVDSTFEDDDAASAASLR